MCWVDSLFAGTASHFFPYHQVFLTTHSLPPENETDINLILLPFAAVMKILMLSHMFGRTGIIDGVFIGVYWEATGHN